MDIRYELRIVRDFDYNSYADVGFFYFSNGVCSTFGPSGHSYKKFCGKTVLCRLQKGTNEKGKEEYFFVGMAEVTKFSGEGRPIEFGDVVNNPSVGYWVPPRANDVIHDERAAKSS